MNIKDINFSELALEYQSGNISLTKMEQKYGISRQTLSRRFKKLGIDIVNKQNELKFNNLVFDHIDTEEKAYWLGFIFADGYVSSTNNTFEISLKGSDKNHLEKFHKFMEHKDINHVKLGTVKCGETKCERCRWFVTDKHLWNVLNSYGCTPNKSTTLQFPIITIFKYDHLIRHFIRGYFDGDGCISRHLYKTKVSPNIQLLGTPEFLDKIEKYSNIFGTRGKDNRWKNNTEYISFKLENGVNFINYIYKDSKIYLDRKYKLYQFFKQGSRSLQEWNELLQTENGEICDDNPVLSSETKEPESVYSVEIEPEKSE